MDAFFTFIQQATETFKKIPEKIVRIISNFDADGITATALLIKALKRENIPFVVSIVDAVTKELLLSLKAESYPVYFFIDLGSGCIKELEEVLKDKSVFILDHHIPEVLETTFIHVNPHLFKIDGTKEICAAGIAYFFCKALNEKNIDLAYLALIGAVGDIQENMGFVGLNTLILDDAVKTGKVEVINSLRIFGMQTKPLHKVLEYSTNPFIPGVTGNEKGALKFLTDLGIAVKVGEKYKKMHHLSTEEMKKLVSSVTLKKIGGFSDFHELYGPVYLLKEEHEDSMLRDIKEFSTLLNSTGRMKKPSLGIGVCLGDRESIEKATTLLMDYRREIIDALLWFYRSRGVGTAIIERERYVIINAENHIRDALIGILASTISKSNIYREGTILIAMAHTLGDETKISMRISGFGESDVNLRKVVHDIVTRIGGSGGGHRLAAGGIIPQDKEAQFLEVTMEVLDKVIVEPAK